MKNVIIALMLALTIVSCDENPLVPPIDEPTEATLMGRWILEGFETNIRIDFTADKKYTIYGTDNEFPSLAEVIATTPWFGKDWVYDGDVVVVDLNFGNESRLIPQFTCGNYVVEWYDEDGALHSRYYRETYDIAECN